MCIKGVGDWLGWFGSPCFENNCLAGLPLGYKYRALCLPTVGFRHGSSDPFWIWVIGYGLSLVACADLSVLRNLYLPIVLAVRNIAKRYGDVVALTDASFDVRPGRIVGFLGRNGAGKTTTMRTVFGLVEPDAGTVTLDGRPIDDEMRHRFGYMPEERGLYPKMKIHEQLVYFGRLSGMAKHSASDSADHWLAELGLEDRRDSKLEDLSHGNQQRVQLATAVLHDPEVLVLDEPFAGLDPIGVTSLSTVLRDFADRGASILFSSHQLDLVEGVCEDVAIINNGVVVVEGTLTSLREQATYRRLLWR